ncbi:MAG TPA: hypothetical protein VKZ84_00140 [Bacteriovoracaceae bacterium]|nr:hypothetical protein [Bacteriovoracaceae bacterium]
MKFNKTVFVNESDTMTELGLVMFAPLINERNLLLKKGQLYPVIESDEEIIVIGERENLVFLCVVDNTQECVKLASLGDSNLSELSDRNLELICK